MKTKVLKGYWLEKHIENILVWKQPHLRDSLKTNEFKRCWLENKDVYEKLVWKQKYLRDIGLKTNVWDFGLENKHIQVALV